jgi:integrase
MKITFPLKVTKQGVSVTIGRVKKNGRLLFRVLYRQQGKRKQAWRSNFKKAKQAADEAIESTLTGDASALKLNASDRHAYLRAIEILAPLNITLDQAAHDYAEARILLAGKATIAEACRDWLKRNAVELPRVTVAEAVAQLKIQTSKDGKSKDRQIHLASHLAAFAGSFNCEVHTITVKQISDYLIALPFVERTKANHREDIGFFNRWLILRGYLAKGTNWLEGVQKYSLQKIGRITTYTPDEMRRLIAVADKRILPFILIAGFAGIRHAEINRLDWQDIDLEENFITVSAEISKTKIRRIVPIKDNLKTFLLPLAKNSGKVVAVSKISKMLLEAAKATGDKDNKIKSLDWKRNALRHTYISARLAECNDEARVAYEAGNSPQIIRSNYDARMRPAPAAEWFSIQPKI